MCDFVEGLTLWSGAAIIANAKINGLERRREKGAPATASVLETFALRP